MKQFKNTTEYMEEISNLKLSDSARARIEENLNQYADFHAVSTPRAAASTSGFSFQATFFHMKRQTMTAFALGAFLFVGAGTSFAAQESLPGDLLYPVKIAVNENVMAALAVSEEAEARLQADLLEERIEEAEALAAEGRLAGELALTVESEIAEQYAEAEAASDAADDETEAETESTIKVALSRFASLSVGNTMAVGTQSDARAGARTMAAREYSETASDEGVAIMEADMAVGTMLALEPIDVDRLHEQTHERVQNLRVLLERYQSAIEADVRAELSAQLDEADDLLLRVMVQSNLNLAEELIYEAADVVGSVEATFSLLGSVTIDSETGAITDIDFSNPPPREPDRDDPIEVGPLPAPMPEPISLPLPVEVLDADGSATLEATSGMME